MIEYGEENVSKLNIYQYYFLDDLTFVRKPEDVFNSMAGNILETIIATVKARFKEAGWEGDGELGIIWIPPFVDIGIEDTWGNYIWHVKQSNNGTSWLASEVLLDFNRLEEFNAKFPYKTHGPVNILYMQCKGLKTCSNVVISSLHRKLSALENLDDPVSAEIKEELLLVSQGNFVAEFQDFLDECYLQVLIEVFDKGNPNRLKIGKFRAHLNPSRYAPITNDDGAKLMDDEAASWFTMKGFISDIWWSYKFESFKEKIGMLCRACDYTIREDIRSMLQKHIAIRNCIQHHQGKLTADSLREVGVSELNIAKDNGNGDILVAWSKINLTYKELELLSTCLIVLASEFHKHICKRIRSVVWIPVDEISVI